MSYVNNNSLSDNLEVDLLRSMIVVVTVSLSFLSFFTDGYPTKGITLWMYFIAISPVIFVFTLFLKKFSKPSLLLLNIFMIVTGLYLKHYVFYLDGTIVGYKIFLVALHFIAINYFFWKVSKTLVLSNEEFIPNMNNKSNVKSSNLRKLTRRRNRRASSRATKSTKIKSGQYRG